MQNKTNWTGRFLKQITHGLGRLSRTVVLSAIGLLGVIPWAQATPSQPNGEYRAEVEEFRVQALGGPVRVVRDYVFDRWQINARWAPLKFTYDNLDGAVKTIERNSALFLPQGDGWAFERRATIRRATVSVLTPGQGEGTAPSSLDGATPAATLAGGLAVASQPGYRWQDRRGNWIDYDASGRLVSYGDRNDVRVWLDYGSGADLQKLQKVRDHFGRTLLVYTWSGSQIVAVGEPAGSLGARHVDYVWSGDQLTQATDVAGQITRFSYSGPRLSRITDPLGRPTQLAYGPTGRLDSLTAPDGAVTRYAYDYDKLKRVFYVRTSFPATAAGQEVEETWYDADGRVVRRDLNGVTQASLLVDTGGRVRTTRDAGGRQTITTLDDHDNVVRTEYPDGGVTSARYSPAHGGVLEETDELGVKTAYAYDGKGNLTTLTEAAGLAEERTTSYTVDTFGQRLSVTRPGNATTQFAYDSFGNLIQLTNAEGGVTRFTHNRAGQVLTLTDARSGVWTRSYDAAGRLQARRNPLGAITSTTYDAAGQALRESDPLQAVTAWTYDAAGRLLTSTDPLGGVRQRSYDARGRLAETRDETGQVTTRLDYDLAGRLSRTTDGAGNATTLLYETGWPQPVELQLPTYRRTLAYDPRGRQTTSIDFLNADTGLTTRIVYDRKGQAIELVDRLGRSTTQAWDALGRLVRVTDPLGGVTSFSYDGRDNLLTVTDATGATHRYTYDRLDRRLTETRPLGETLQSAYDATANLVQTTDAVGNVTRFTVDAANRRTQEARIPAGESVPSRIIDTTFDAADRLTGYTDTRGGQVVSAAQYTLDALGRKTGETVTVGGVSHTLGAAYAANGQTRQRRYPDGFTIDYGYDGGGRLVTVTTGDGAASFGGYQWTQPTEVTLPGGSRQTRSIDPLQRLTGLTQTSPTQQPIFALGLSWDAQSNVSRKTVAGQATDYAYDALDRLTAATGAGGSEAWTYDAVGNRLSDASTGTPAWTYNGNHQLTARPNRAGQSLAYTHDANGSRTQSRNEADSAAPTAENLSSVYDEANRLVAINDAGGQPVARYTYDPFGRRIGKTVFQTLSADGRYQALTVPQTTGFLYGDEGLLAETDGAGQVTVLYGWKPDGLWGTDPLFRRQGTQTSWYVNDQLGTPQRLVTAAGSVAWAGQAKAFGETVVAPSPAIDNPLRFPGQYFDAETGTHYNYKRDYESSTGRYVQSDPIGLKGGINTYSYVEGNPLTGFDPLGLATANPANQLNGAFFGGGGSSGASAGSGGGVGGAVGAAAAAAAGAAISNAMSGGGAESDSGLQQDIEREANRREYKNICGQQPPPGLDPCERAKWELNKAKACKGAREENTRRWWGGVDNRHSAQLFEDLDRQIRNAERAVERLCKCK